jgi:hypothetical protein
MSSPILALRRAMLAALAADSALVALLGGARIHDEAPPGAPFPRVVFSDAQCRDWSAQISRGAEQVVTISAWSDRRGTRQALDIADRIVAVLDEAQLTLAGHSLVDLRFVALVTRREQNGRLARADVRFRATTEQA